MLKGMKFRYCVYELSYRDDVPHFVDSFDNESQATEFAASPRMICIDSETMEVCE